LAYHTLGRACVVLLSSIDGVAPPSQYARRSARIFDDASVVEDMMEVVLIFKEVSATLNGRLKAGYRTY